MEEMNNNLYEVTQQPVTAKKGFAIASLVFGILALLTTLFLINYVFGILAIIFGVIYLKKKADVKPKGKVIAGLVCAGLSLLISTTIWVSAYVYITKTDVATILEDVAGLMGNDIDGREMIDEAIKEYTNNFLDLAQIEEIVGGEVSLGQILNFVDDVTEQELAQFIEEVQSRDLSKLKEEFKDGVTYELLEEKLGKNFTLKDLLEYVDKNAPIVQ